jgi:hypothetical protein
MLSLEELSRTFRKEVLVWYWLNAPYDEQRKVLLFLVEQLGYDQDALQKSRKIVKENHGDVTDVFTILTGYRLIKDIASLVSQVIGEDTLHLCPRDGIVLSEDRIKRYSIIPTDTVYDVTVGWAKAWRRVPAKKPREHYSIPMDAPAGFALLYRGEPNAVYSFYVSDSNTLTLCGIQGIKIELSDENGRFRKGDCERTYGRGARGLFPIDWQKFGVEYASKIARSLGLTRIGIRSGHNNFLTQRRYKDTKRTHLPLERAVVLYDNVAERLGFEQDSLTKNWYKDISL